MSILKDSHDPKILIGCEWWKVFHTICASANLNTEDGRNGVLHFIKATQLLFPCEKCRKNFIEKVNMYPPEIYMKNRSNEDLFFMSYLYHDIVNQHNNKTSPKYEDVRNEYFNKFGLSNKCKSCNS